jgi:hypothetical protein
VADDLHRCSEIEELRCGSLDQLAQKNSWKRPIRTVRLCASDRYIVAWLAGEVRRSVVRRGMLTGAQSLQVMRLFTVMGLVGLLVLIVAVSQVDDRIVERLGAGAAPTFSRWFGRPR